MPSKLTSNVVIEKSEIAFGTSGARGLVTQFTVDVCAAFTVAFLHSMKKTFHVDRIALAIDNRPSGYKMAQACAAALKQKNISVIYYGVIPTPALALISQEDTIPAIMVTGSHIPFDRNGLKFYRPDGEISKKDELTILNETVSFSPIIELPELSTNDRAAEMYIVRYTSLFDSLWLKGKRIGIYEHSSSGRDLYSKIFKSLGAEVYSLERSDQFIPIDTEAVSDEDTQKAITWSKQHQLDMVFSTDGDGDRPLISDENGNWLRGDILGLLTSQALNIETLAVPINCNSSTEKCGFFEHIERTKIGSPYVIAEFSKLSSKYTTVAGFEANGGYLLGCNIEVNGKKLRALPTRDAMLPAIMLLVLSQHKLISNIVSALPKRYTYSERIQNFATEKSRLIITSGVKNPGQLLSQLGFDHINIQNVNCIDGLRITLSNNNILHLRASGNAPELRCYAEADTFSDAHDIVVGCLNKIQTIDLILN